MNASADELVTIIGEQTIALRLLRAELQAEQAKNAKLEQEAQARDETHSS